MNSRLSRRSPPALAHERGSDRVHIGGRHRADARRLHRPILAGVSAIIEAMATLSRSDVEHVAYLARLGLSDAELTRLEGELNHILDQYAILAELPTDDIPPTAQTIELENILREDIVKPSLPVEAVLANAPERDGDFIVVPAILDER
jgi:aspartyl-tRNA(Asn)/glutamyl-tRNA(Gln) amidotransferase subunit C